MDTAADWPCRPGSVPGPPAGLPRSVCDKTDTALVGTVRAAASMLQGSLPHAAIVAGADPREVWSWPLSRLVLEAARVAGVGERVLGRRGGLTPWATVRTQAERLRVLVGHAAWAEEQPLVERSKDVACLGRRHLSGGRHRGRVAAPGKDSAPRRTQ